VTLDFSMPGMVMFSMDDCIKNLFKDVPADMEGTAKSPVVNNLFTINDEAEKLDATKSEEFHWLTTKLLYLSKHIRVDIQPMVVFLMMRVKQPDIDD
jgi:hypothetical protein